jgi:hypothetical protein
MRPAGRVGPGPGSWPRRLIVSSCEHSARRHGHPSQIADLAATWLDANDADAQRLDVYLDDSTVVDTRLDCDGWRNLRVPCGLNRGEAGSCGTFVYVLW